MNGVWIFLQVDKKVTERLSHFEIFQLQVVLSEEYIEISPVKSLVDSLCRILSKKQYDILILAICCNNWQEFHLSFYHLWL